MMSTRVTDFDYDLPDASIAQSPVTPRDASRLLVLDRKTGEMRDEASFRAILNELVMGDVLVFNVSKVFNARLVVDGVEVFVLAVRDGEIDALVRGSRRFPVGSMIGEFTVMGKSSDGIVTLKTERSSVEMFAFCEDYGSVPTPPYISEALEDADRYQTVYAKAIGSVAAPTAGLHFTPELIAELRARGVQIEEVTLHVGIGTFRPVQVEDIADHVMHAEMVEVDEGTASRICAAKREGRRVIAVGTTSTRVLEGVTSMFGALHAYAGPVNIFITPGFRFQIIDGLITNFHLPKSTLLMLVSAFSTRDHVLTAYHHAVDTGYRFFSFGDAMFLR